ncbi:MAG: STAS/SEC14 domain-containing protein [Gammaproteobacteria bacterium]|nr:STAS/SEC14 domain-containing protein [Gammaproteobacteria bacterium]
MTTTYKEDPEHKIAELVVDGKVRHEDFNNIAVQLENFIEKQGRIKLLEEIRTLESIDASMVWEGIKFDIKNLKHIRHISHCAVVSDIGWLSPISKAAGALISCKIRTFTLDQIDEARTWLQTE